MQASMKFLDIGFPREKRAQQILTNIRKVEAIDLGDSIEDSKTGCILPKIM